MSYPESSGVHVLPRGKYLIGDPCYMIPDKLWLGTLDRTGYFGIPDHVNKPECTDWDEGLYHIDGEKCFAFSTQYGDGCYPLYNASTGQLLKELGVDAGLMGLMPVNVAKLEGGSWLCYEHTFEDDFPVYRTHQGIFIFGNLTVVT